MEREDILKDFVEHLRTVHFSLVVVTLGLFVVMSSPGSRQLVEAQEQIDKIKEVAATEWDREFLQRLAEPALKQANLQKAPLPCKTIAWDGEPSAFGSSLTLAFNSREWVILPHENSVGLGFDRVYSNPLSSDAEATQENCAQDQGEFADTWVEPPKTLADFRDDWNKLAGAAIFYKVRLDRNIFFTEHEDRLSRPRQWKEAKTNLTLHSEKLRLVELTNDESEALGRDPQNHLFKFAFRGGSGIAKFKIYVPVTFTEDPLPLDAQGYFIAQRKLNWRRGQFDDTFRELFQVSERFIDSPLETISKVVDSEVDKSKDSFEAFGIKFPSETTLYWGAVLIVGIQMYFCLHLKKLADMLTHGDHKFLVAWIGVYDHSFARVVFISSSFLLPFIAACYMAYALYRVIHFGLFWTAASVVSLFLSGLFAVAGFKSYRAVSLHVKAER